MLWAVWNEWPSSAQFTFKCYCHWSTLVIQDMRDGTGQFLHSKEGVTQGDPLVMIAYGIGVSPSSGSFRNTTLVSHNLGTRMTRWQGRSSPTSSIIFGTSKRRARHGDTTWSRPKEFWSWTWGMQYGQRSSFWGWE